MLTKLLPKKYKKRIINKMQKNDIFMQDANLEITKKGSRGSVSGFCFTMFYFIILIVYIYSQVKSFFTFDQETFETHMFELES